MQMTKKRPSDGKIALNLSFLFESSPTETEGSDLIASIVDGGKNFKLADFLKTLQDVPYYTYFGSTTTPPCYKSTQCDFEGNNCTNEGTRWIVFDKKHKITKKQLAEITKHFAGKNGGNGNNRRI